MLFYMNFFFSVLERQPLIPEQDKMSFYLNEAAGDIRDIMLPTLEAPKAKL